MSFASTHYRVFTIFWRLFGAAALVVGLGLAVAGAWDVLGTGGGGGSPPMSRGDAVLSVVIGLGAAALGAAFLRRRPPRIGPDAPDA